MKVVLIKNEPKLGQIGDIKDVADGYARNYLFPENMAKPATESEIAKAQEFKKNKEKEIKIRKINMESQAEKLQGMKLTISAKADEQGTFFAGITADKIADQLKKENLSVKAKQIKLDEPIKKSGNYNVNIQSGDKVVQIDLEAKAK